MRTPLLLPALFLAATAASPAAAQVVNGQLLERGSDRPVAGASVELRVGGDAKARALTDTAGLFTIPVEDAGRYRLSVQRVGFEPILSASFVVDRQDTTHVLLRLVAGTIMLAPVRAIAEARSLPPTLVAFYDRVEENRAGRFITRDQLDTRRALRASDLLRTIAGMRVVATRRGTAVRTREGCEPMIFVDGMYVPLNGMSLDDMVQPQNLEGVEVYSGPSSLPPSFVRIRAPGCGAVLFWTKIEN